MSCCCCWLALGEEGSDAAGSANARLDRDVRAAGGAWQVPGQVPGQVPREGQVPRAGQMRQRAGQVRQRAGQMRQRAGQVQVRSWPSPPCQLRLALSPVCLRANLACVHDPCAQ